MSKQTDGKEQKPFAQRYALSPIFAVVNFLLLAVAAVSIWRYADLYQTRLREENLGNIANLNSSSALNATALIDSHDIKLKDIALYISRHDMTHEETLRFIEQSNSDDSRLFELIGKDYSGYIARRNDSGGFIPLSYQTSSYSELQKALDDINDSAFDDVCFTPEFTDNYSALKCFAVYRHLVLKNAVGEDENYTLLLATKTKDFLNVFNKQNGFDGQSTVLIDSKGDYIVSNSDFKSTNFFQYLYVYNDLTLDKRNAIESELTSNKSGNIYYKNALGEDCVFCYEQMATNGWYCVTGVPIASFRTPVSKANFIIYAAVALLLLLITDVAWLNHMNRRLRISAIREKEASSAKTEFLSRMSHDIRTPLNGIIGLTDLALDEQSSPQLKDYLENIKASGQFLTGLVNDILDMSKVESGKVDLSPEPYSSNDMRKYVEAVVAPLCKEKGLELRLLPSGNTPTVLLDRLRFNQVIFNLLSNAVKYTPSGGFVELSWNCNELPDGRVAIDICVRDNGIGMSEEFQKHMFDSFTQERLQTANTGTGLGLAIVNSIVNLMNGTISVESKQNVGSAFSVHLETVLCPEAETVVSEVTESTLDGKRVLLCEDNEINIMVAQKLLEKWGMSVDVAQNGRLGVEMFLVSEPFTYDVILMDVMMPEMNGIDATIAIRKLDRQDSSLPIVAMTANAYDSDVKDCLACGMNAHTAKPIDRDSLHTLLCELTNTEVIS